MKARALDTCPKCQTFCAEVGGVGACPGDDDDVYMTRYECEGHPLNRAGPVPCGWTGVLPGSDKRDPTCPSCGGWVRKQDAAQLRRVK